MQIIKYSFILALLVFALYITKKYTEFVDARIKYTRIFLKFLQHIEGKISSFLSPPSELGDGFAGEELSQMVERLKKGESLVEAYSSERENLPREADGVLFAYFSDFGKGNLDLELSRLKKGISDLGEVLSVAEAEGEKRKKLCTSVAPALALGIIIWLI